MFRKIFRKNISVWQIVLISTGSILGLLLVWLPMQLYFDITAALHQHKELINSQYLVVNKGVSLLHTMGIASTGFSEEELQGIESQKGVQRVSIFTSGNFKATASAELGHDGPQLMTEIFFEAVPDEYIDEIPGDWHWQEGDENVPVIVPADYLSLYNFGFAPGQGLPQISQNTAKLAGFWIDIPYAAGHAKYRGKIAGFSDRINTILVPLSFLQYANSHYATQPPRLASRIIVQANDVTALSAYLDRMGYETNKETLRSGKVQSIAQAIMSLALALGLMIVILSLGSFLQFSDLLMARSDYEIQTLIYLGYGHERVARIIFRQVFSIILMAAVVAAVIGVGVRLVLLHQLAALVESASVLPDIRAVALLLAIVVIYLLVAYRNVYVKAHRMAMSK